MSKKFLYVGIALSALFVSCKKDDASMPVSGNNPGKAARTTGAQTIQNAAFYNEGTFNQQSPYLSLTYNPYTPVNYDYVDALPYCLGGSCGIYTTYKIYIRQNNTSNFEGPYDVTEVTKTSTYYYPGQTIYILRAYIPKIGQLAGMRGNNPIYKSVSHNGLYYVCLVPPGTTPTLNPADPTQQLLINFGDNNI
ncbi:hypothetical protein [Taibaiella soli]|uniref:Lipoprotein n=1 Tax=Taibaiella soli TaxID=1649169 RepID=A0A2W2BX38_9BACT|nr:hypothetical protein [Taibaiella soli]PZF72423.1 hypothetical protein DN068_13810 [Taibaiella soli]